MAFLLVVSGPNEGDFHPLESKRSVTVGRNEDCTIQIVDAKVSRTHLRVSPDPAGGYDASEARDGTAELDLGKRGRSSSTRSQGS